MIKRVEKVSGFLAGLIVVFVFVFSGCERIREQKSDAETPQQQPSPSLPQSIHLFFGNPSNASEDDRDNYLIIGDGSAISYNDSLGTANWVSWRTIKADLGPSIPRPDFRSDPRLPPGFKRIGYYDYSGSGYDRGHLVPSADRFADPKLNEETFMMTNIVPQTSALNQYPWEKLESYIRSQVKRGFDAYQIAGVYGDKGILKGKVVVPANCWKIVVLMPRGRPLEQFNTRMRVIAVDMPNIDGVDNVPWERYKTSVRTIEERTGYDFFSTLPHDIQDAIETRVEMSNKRNY